MSIKCPNCGREFDVTLFEYGRSVWCACGERITLDKGHVDFRGGAGGKGSGKGGESGKGSSREEEDRDKLLGGFDWESLEKEIFSEVERKERVLDRKRMSDFMRDADRITSLILHSDMPRVDIEIEIRNFRARVVEHFPEKEELFDAIYLGRFRRLWTQFRQGEEPIFGGG